MNIRIPQLLLIATALLWLGNVALRFDGTAVWDDAYFFVRYADNFIEHQNFAWNAAEPAAYGLTAPIFGVAVLIGRFLAGPPAAVLWSLSLGFALVAGLGLWRLWQRSMGKSGPREMLLCMGALTLLCQVPALAVHATSGMETSLAMVWVIAWLGLYLRFEGALSPGRSLILGLLGGGIYLLRPEMLLFTLGLPAVLLLVTKGVQRRQVGYWLVFSAFFLLAEAFGAQSIFESVLPLSFQVKSVGHYGPEFTHQYRSEALQQGAMFLLANAVPVALILGALLRGKGGFWRHLRVSERILLVLGALFWCYESLAVLQVMGYHQRFYYPAWPILIYLAGRSGRWWWEKRRGPGNSMGFLLASLGIGIAVGLSWWHRPPNLSQRLGHFSTAHVYTQLGQHNWHLLDQISEFPDDLHLASTELGILSAMNPGKTITDLSGLNDPVLAKGFDPEHVVQRAPDLLYLPHPANVTMRERLLEHQRFQAEYEIFSEADLESYMGIALRKDGRYYPALRELLVPE